MAIAQDSRPAHAHPLLSLHEKPAPDVQETESDSKKPPKKPGRLRSTYLFPVLHILWCILLVLCMVFLLDEYHAILPDTPRYADKQLRLRVSDVTTIISVALVVTRLLVGAWMSVILWNVVFVLLETSGLRLDQVNQTLTYYLPPWHAMRHKGTGIFVVVLLLLMVPQLVIGPLVSGAVDWDVGFTYSPHLEQTQAGYPGASPFLWFWYYYSGEDRRAYVRRAAAYASIAWDGRTVDGGHCRHIVNDDGFPVNSSVLDATIPCLQIHSITFPTEYPPDDIMKLVDDSVHASGGKDNLTRVGDAPLSYGIDGNAVLFDKDDRPGMFGKFPPEGDGTDGFRRKVPSAYLHSGIFHAVVLINGSVSLNGNNCTDLKENIFGMKSFNNIFTPNERGNYYRCFTYAVVNLTAGVVKSPTSTYVSSRVIQGDAVDSELESAPWVQEAMYLMPDIMSVFSMMNSSSLSTWENLEEYVTRLIRYSYQGSWDMLSRSFVPDDKFLSVRRYEQRQVAQVSRPRVFGWLGVSLALTLSWILLVLGKRFSTRDIVVDGPVAALVTDCSPLLQAGHDLTNMSSASETKKVGRVILGGNAGKYSLSKLD